VNAKQERFCKEFVIDHIATRAAARAGYSAAGAHRLLHTVSVRARIAELERAQKVRLEVDADRVLQELLHIAMHDPKEMFDEDGRQLPVPEMPEAARRCIAGWTFDKLGQLQPKVVDKLRALELLGKYKKLFSDETNANAPQVNITISGIRKGQDDE
jgi:phage terminase small subunit